MNIKGFSVAALIAVGLLTGKAAFAQDAWSLAKDADGIQV